ncbi:MAG: hypothetical protein JSU81_08255 [Candidatus Coatesbacteria bacterium]|nr:MAG: hypothetical protein JSU81_08255 [Candidatus Coatesbacteria bacterium]
MRKVVVTALICASVAFACQKGEEPAEGTALAPETGETARPASLIFPEAERAEALLRAAEVPFASRPDLIRELPEGCVWHAVYGTADPEVILETYAFMYWDGAISYAEERGREFDLMDVLREYRTVHNGALLLVAYYYPGEEAAAQGEVLTKFISAFAGEE